MRKTSAVLASLSLAAVALTGCAATASSDGGVCGPGTGANDIRDAVTVDGEFGQAPEAEIFAPLQLPASSIATAIEGDGRAVVNDQQAFVIDFSIFDGDSGDKVFASSYAEGQGQVSNADYWASQSPGLAKVFECAREGSRIVAGITPEDFGPDVLTGLGLDEDADVVFVVDVIDVFLPKAEGALQFNDARGMPTVVRAADGTPGVIIPDSAAPKKQVVQTLIRGEGDEVSEDQLPLVNMTAVSWDDKSVLSTTWGQGPTAELATTAPVVAEAVVGEPVGSQLLVVVPGEGETPAVAYVVDILGAVTAPKA